MIKFTNKLYGASLFALAFSLSAAEVSAQTCTAAPSCETLGFTKSSADCSGKTSLKCPFDQSKYFCLGDGEGDSGERGYCGSPEIGDVLYSDMTCARLADLDKNKRVIGVIFDQSRRLAVALEEKQLAWSIEYFDIPDLVNRTSDSAGSDFAGKTNTASAWKYCKDNGKSCPAFEYVSSYKTQGTNAGDWYLPAMGELNELYLNRDAVNVTMAKISGTSLCTTSGCSSGSYYYLSSSEYTFNNAWYQFFNTGGIYYGVKYGSNPTCRPVLAF